MPVCLFIKCYALFNKGLQEGVKSEKRISIQGRLFKSQEYISRVCHSKVATGLVIIKFIAEKV